MENPDMNDVIINEEELPIDNDIEEEDEERTRKNVCDEEASIEFVGIDNMLVPCIFDIVTSFINLNKNYIDKNHGSINIIDRNGNNTIYKLSDVDKFITSNDGHFAVIEKESDKFHIVLHTYNKNYIDKIEVEFDLKTVYSFEVKRENEKRAETMVG